MTTARQTKNREEVVRSGRWKCLRHRLRQHRAKEINGLGVHGAQEKVPVVNSQSGNLLILEQSLKACKVLFAS